MQTNGWRSKAVRNEIRDSVEAHRTRQRQTAYLRQQHVLDTEMTPEQLLAAERQRKADTMARHPDWFEGRAA